VGYLTTNLVVELVMMRARRGLISRGNRSTGALGVPEFGGRQRVEQMQASGTVPIRKVIQPALGKDLRLARPVLPTCDVCRLCAQPAHHRSVVDRGRVRPPGANQFIGCVLETEIIGCISHQTVEAAKQEEQLGLVARPDLAVEDGEDPVSYPAHFTE
jgi:hypothetical protein